MVAKKKAAMPVVANGTVAKMRAALLLVAAMAANAAGSEIPKGIAKLPAHGGATANSVVAVKVMAADATTKAVRSALLATAEDTPDTMEEKKVIAHDAHVRILATKKDLIPTMQDVALGAAMKGTQCDHAKTRDEAGMVTTKGVPKLHVADGKNG